jgi:putative phosphoribosyl transferase
MKPMLFKDRYDAASRLIPYLEKYKNEPGIVFAVPRGGVPIGYYIAKNYNLPLELLLTKKIGHPGNKELAIGAVSLEDHILDERHLIPEPYIYNEITKIRESLKEGYKKFMGDQKPADLEGKIVIIVDDGIATGNTLRSAIRLTRSKHPKKIVVAVPVAPVETANILKKEVDDFICPHTVENFTSVGLYYSDFSQVSDEEVVQLLKEANRLKNTP